MAALLLLLSHADTAVKATLCRQDTLKTLFRAIEYCPHHLQLTVLKAVKQLTSDPSMLEALQVGPGSLPSLKLSMACHAVDAEVHLSMVPPHHCSYGQDLVHLCKCFWFKPQQWSSSLLLRAFFSHLGSLFQHFFHV